MDESFQGKALFLQTASVKMEGNDDSSDYENKRYIGRFWAVFIMVCWVMGIVSAAQEEEKPVPLIGGIQIIK